MRLTIKKIMKKNQSISELIYSPQYQLSNVPKIGTKTPPINPIMETYPFCKGWVNQPRIKVCRFQYNFRQQRVRKATGRISSIIFNVNNIRITYIIGKNIVYIKKSYCLSTSFIFSRSFFASLLIPP